MAAFGQTWRVSDTFNRPANTTAYAIGNLVANSTTAGSVVPLTFVVARGLGTGGMIRRVRIRKSGTGITKASFRLHLYTVAPATITNGDGAAWSTSGVADYMGPMDIIVDKAFTDGASGVGVPSNGIEINYTHQTLYGLLEARGAYTPASAETFFVVLEVLPN